MFSRLLQQHWYQSKPTWLSILLFPIEWLYRVLLSQKVRNDCIKQHQTARLGIPVVVVGNLTVGGVGKTPVIQALAEHLISQGYHPGIISRGYKGQSQHYPLDVTPQTDPVLAGDEPVMLAALTQCPVMVDPDRPNAAKAILAQHNVDVVLADDGLQHYALARDIEIVVIDGERGLGNQRCIPAGPLREPVQRIGKADFILVNGGHFETKQSHPFHLSPQELKPIRRQNSNFTNCLNPGGKIHAVAAIGHPDRFFRSLEGLGFDIIPHRFSDHYHYQKTDFDFNDDLPIVMTEKDAVKCQSLNLKNGYYLPVKAELPHAFLQAFDEQLKTLSSSEPQD